MSEHTLITNDQENDAINYFIGKIHNAIGDTNDSERATLPEIEITSVGALPSAFAVTELATASIASAGLELSKLIALSGADAPKVQLDRRLSSFWFASSIRPTGWSLPPSWDAIAGDYQTADGWIRLHTNAPRHRAAALAVLGISVDSANSADKIAVGKVVSKWHADELETAIVGERGCAAAMKDRSTWHQHEQGGAVRCEPLIARQHYIADDKSTWKLDPNRPLRGIKVIDLTRIIAGPVASRFLAGYGAEVLRIDPPEWDEPSLVAELTIGKRCARLDLTNPLDKRHFEDLLRDADVLVHGYRADALAALGLDAERRRQINPALIDVSLNAYGHSGPWHHRRGFDSLVQMSCGIAEHGMRHFGKNQPTPLPVQALDHATGYMMAAAVIRGLHQRYLFGVGHEMRVSLARTAELLFSGSGQRHDTAKFPVETKSDLTPENTIWGAAHRLLPPLQLQNAPMRWDICAGNLGVAKATWY